MQVDPDRIAARLRIEAEIEEDYARRVGRRRRQLGQPKEVTIQVGFCRKTGNFEVLGELIFL
jgi:hypothetical protein